MNRRDFLFRMGAAATGAMVLGPRFAHAAPKPVIAQGFRMVIDPGHGGENSGCHGHGHEEKALTLTLAQELAGRVVELMPHAEILLTRELDETLHLSQRVALANDCKADLFLSLHCNASPNSDQAGFETFLLDVDASSKDAALTAQRENSGAGVSAVPADGEVGIMLRELGMTNNRKLAAHYAHAIQSEQAKRFPQRSDRGVRQAAFDVLLGARMPAVLHEVAFLDHPEDSKLLIEPERRATIVEGLAVATLRYYNEVVRRS